MAQSKASTKGRLQSAYDKKVRRIVKWHNRLTKERTSPRLVNPNTDLFPKVKELRPLAEYIEKVRRPSGKVA